MYNVDKYFDLDYKAPETKSNNSEKDKKKDQQKYLVLILLAGLADYYFLVYLPEEEKKKKMEWEKQQQNTDNRTTEEIKEEQEKDAWDKGRIWELSAHSWADRIVKAKSTSLIGQYQKTSNLFTDGDRNPKFYFSRSASYKIYFPPSCQSYYEKGKESRDDKFSDKLSMLEQTEKLILSDTIESWIQKVEINPIRGETGFGKKDNCALFYGAPGTGKTATMKNVCVQGNNYPLVEIKGSALTPTEEDQTASILPLEKFAYTLSELEWNLVKECGFERENNGEVRYILFVDEANQISNNSAFFQPNQLRFLKDCMEGIDQNERSNNLWVFATNHLDQVEEATYREGRLSNPLNFNWNWNEFKKYAQEYSIYNQFPGRWKETNFLKPEDNQWITKFNKKLFQKEFLGDNPDHPYRPKFWDRFITNNPNAQIETEEDEVDKEGKKTGKKVKIDIEIGEFLEFFWGLYDSKDIMSYQGGFDSFQKETVEKVLDVRLTELIDETSRQLDNIRKEISDTRKDKQELIIADIKKIFEILAKRNTTIPGMGGLGAI